MIDPVSATLSGSFFGGTTDMSNIGAAGPSSSGDIYAHMNSPFLVNSKQDSLWPLAAVGIGGMLLWAFLKR